MVAAAATGDAVRRAREMKDLRVGLHVVLVNGRPMLPPSSVPDLVDERGEFLTDLGRAGVRFFFRRGVRAQLEAEIEAQFQAFARTGLELDHVNAQNHMHVHPTVLRIILRVGRRYGLHAVRVPYEPLVPSWRSGHDRLFARLGNGVLLLPWLALMKLQLRRARLVYNEFIFGMGDTGRMTPQRVLGLLPNLPRGVSEVYFHPAMHGGPEQDEYRALVDPQVKDAISRGSIRPLTFGELANGRG